MLPAHSHRTVHIQRRSDGFHETDPSYGEYAPRTRLSPALSQAEVRPDVPATKIAPVLLPSGQYPAAEIPDASSKIPYF